jgi:hypothetical protein
MSFFVSEDHLDLNCHDILLIILVPWKAFSENINKFGDKLKTN